MSIILRMRRSVLTPNVSATRVAVRGFYAKDTASVALLENVGKSFLAGYGHAVGTRSAADARVLLEAVAQQYRGFAYEGAAMGYAILEGLGVARKNTVTAFLSGPGSPHVYMAYVGVGWAMARLPAWRARRLQLPDELLGWLAIDGYGFHQAYFHTRRYVHERRRDQRWHGFFGAGPEQVAQVIDQGVGRALWFVEGTDVTRLAERIASFPVNRRADLWSGSGLAATYAGGASEPELRRMWEAAGQFRPQVAQAAAFAAEARVRAGLATEHTALATRVFCGMAPPDAAALTVQARDGLPSDAAVPAYHIWRERVANQFAAIGRC